VVVEVEADIKQTLGVHVDWGEQVVVEMVV
jgi:hypothetical protein